MTARTLKDIDAEITMYRLMYKGVPLSDPRTRGIIAGEIHTLEEERQEAIEQRKLRRRLREYED